MALRLISGRLSQLLGLRVMAKKFRYLAPLIATCAMFTSATAARAENWVQFYADGETRDTSDADSVQQLGDGRIKVVFRTTFYAPQHPPPDSSIPESGTFYTRQQLDEFDCRNQQMAVLGIWYLGYNFEMLGGSEGHSPDNPIRQGTVASLLVQTICR